MVYRQSPSGPVDPSFRALSGRLKLKTRRHKFNKDSLSGAGVRRRGYARVAGRAFGHEDASPSENNKDGQAPAAKHFGGGQGGDSGKAGSRAGGSGGGGGGKEGGSVAGSVAASHVGSHAGRAVGGRAGGARLAPPGKKPVRMKKKAGPPPAERVYTLHPNPTP